MNYKKHKKTLSWIKTLKVCENILFHDSQQSINNEVHKLTLNHKFKMKTASKSYNTHMHTHYTSYVCANYLVLKRKMLKNVFKNK